MICFYLGGARSGKSQRALGQAQSQSAAPTRHFFVATAEPVDDEFAQRIGQHQSERGDQWRTVEEPLQLARVLSNLDQDDVVVIVDCLTVWLGNLMHHNVDVNQAVLDLLSFLKKAKGDYHLVSNEVGQGVVPEHSLGRLFRDEQGRINQQVAQHADRVELLVAGIPLTVKGAS